MTGSADLPLWAAPRARGQLDLLVELPGSKSLTNRELVLAALADGPGVVRRALRSRDTELMARALGALGSTVDTDGPDWSVTPGLIGAGPDPVDIDCGLAGTVMRFVPPVAALRNGPSRFDGDPHARTRPMAAVLDALRGLGVGIVGPDPVVPPTTLPFTVTGRGSVAGGPVVIDASASSQFVSALLLAGAAYRDGVEIIHRGPPVPSQPHIEMTVDCLRARGVQVEAAPDRWRVLPGPIEARDVDIEPDLSNAAPFLMLALTAGGRVRVPGWPQRTTQAGDALREILTRMGARVELGPDALSVTGTGRVHGIDIDLHEVGELAPAVAALAALADSPSHLRGIGHIRGHETDRLSALATELTGLGADVTEHPDGLSIAPAPLHGGTFRTYADHRMAQAAVIIGSAVDGILVEDIATTAKTFPGFEHLWAELLGS